MKKFWTVILKIIMFVSIAGIIVFSCIAIISNRNIQYEAFNFLTVNKSSLKINDFVSKVDGNIFSAKGEKDDPYVNFLGTIIMDANSSLDYYLDFLALDSNLSKGEQNRLIEDFKACKNAKQTCEDLYDDYKEAYSGTSASHVAYCEKEFLREYRGLYNCFATLLVDLYKACKINVVSVESYDFQKLIVRTGLASAVVDSLYCEENIEKSPNNRINIKDNSLRKTYLSFDEKKSYYSDEKMATDNDLQQYVYNLGSLDIFLWAKNYDEYLTTLNNSLKERAINAKAFFDDNFKEGGAE